MRKLGMIGLAGIVAATAFGVWSADTVANSEGCEGGGGCGVFGSSDSRLLSHL